MGDLRALIKELLAEELASMRAELACDATIERVNVSTSADLNRFASSILDRATDPRFVAALRNGRLHFEPVWNVETRERVEQLPPSVMRPVAERPETLVTTVPPRIPELRKGLITERDLAAVANGETRLRITKTARLTPLANDEARRRGIRIERTIE
ncbi:hypothetical protein QMZ05_03775 [Bradyrhizobium sp. INPA03-11B]|uniref:hypothetical protein n=1 Tax=Bradyrhizobium sp. INPA03-11B TaxID=418598 RepID=UPI00338D9C73